MVSGNVPGRVHCESVDCFCHHFPGRPHLDREMQGYFIPKVGHILPVPILRHCDNRGSIQQCEYEDDRHSKTSAIHDPLG